MVRRIQSTRAEKKMFTVSFGGIIAIEGFIRIEVDLVDQATNITFDYELKNLPDGQKPVLEFEAYQQGKVQRLNSDTLLRAAVKKLNLEPDGAQALIETLHRQGWITYPRASVEKAEEVPIKIQDEKDGIGIILICV